MDETISAPIDFRAENGAGLDDLPPGPGYVRLATVTRNGEETFRRFTNPIWMKSTVPGERRLRVNCLGW